MIYLAINDTTGYLEQMFSDEQSAIDWATAMTAKTGDTYTIDSEEMC